MIASKSFDGAYDALKRLQSLPITLHVLSRTRVGMTVNLLRKSSDDQQVTDLAKLLIKHWKRLLNGSATPETGARTSPAPTRPREPTTPSKPVSGVAVAEEESASGNNGATPVRERVEESRFPLSAAPTSDSVRLKCREMLTTALRADPVLPEGSGDPESLAERLEEAIFAEFRNTDVKYKNRVRSRMANLKDMKNTNLRVNYLTAAIAPEKLARMTPEEMASDEMRALRERFNKEAINDAQLAAVQGTKTSLLKCGKCLKRNCTYNQVQTRSADEPMTTFVLCNECGHRWKFC